MDSKAYLSLLGYHKIADGDKASGLNAEEDLQMEVQYNPGGIQFSGRTKFWEGAEGYGAVPSLGVVSVNVELKRHSRDSSDPSVAEWMDAMLWFMQKSPDQRVRFHWADLEIDGTVTSFSGRYTMFHASGLPAAGEMKLTIQSESNPQQVGKRVEALTKERSNRVKDKNSRSADEGRFL